MLKYEEKIPITQKIWRIFVAESQHFAKGSDNVENTL